ncbi:TolC family outer membrane protein [Desulfosarcina sp. OttesenSCG-928-B08]|nr:TolC family outer membrane protein [Desulfosarcina sp. OttesenSCG-928-B08]
MRNLMLMIFVMGMFQAQTARAMDVMEAYELALAQDPQLRAAHFQHDAVRETVRQAWANFLPDVNASVEIGHVFQDVVDSDNRVYAQERADYLSKQYTIQLVQPVFYLQHFYTLSQSKTTLNRADFELLAAEQYLLLRVADAYFSILLAQDEITALQEEEAAIRLHYQVASEKNKKGLAPLIDVYDAEARLEEVLAERVEAERVLASAKEGLAEIVGDYPICVNPMKPGFHPLSPDPDELESWLGISRIKNAVLLIKRLESMEYAEEIKRQRSAHVPTVELIGRWNRDDTDGSLYSGGSTVNSFQVMGRVSIPLYSGGIIESRVRESIALYQKALKEVISQERQAVRQVTDAFYGTKSAARRALAAEKSIKSQTLSLEARKIGYQAGRYDSLSVLDAIRDLATDKKNFNTFHYQHIIEFMKLKYQAGGLTVSDLEQINAMLDRP